MDEETVDDKAFHQIVIPVVETGLFFKKSKILVLFRCRSCLKVPKMLETRPYGLNTTKSLHYVSTDCTLAEFACTIANTVAYVRKWMHCNNFSGLG